MPPSPQEDRTGLSERELKKLRGELWIIVPFFVYCLYVFIGSFRYKFEASTVPMVIGLATALLVGLRLFHIIFPRSRLGQFREAGLAGEFDLIKEGIEEEAFKGRHEDEGPSKEITSRDERKAFLALIYSCLCFVFFGYVVGALLVIVGTSFYYGYRRLVPILVSAAAMFLLLYVVLYRLFGAEMTWGLVLEPIIEALRNR